MRLHRGLVTIGLLLAGISSSERALAQASGVLLGIAGESSNPESDTQSFETIHPPKYQTLWIASDEKGAVKVLASLPELIVPRNDGFWHVGVEQVCEFDDGKLTSSPGNESMRQVVWAAPVTRGGVVERNHPCTHHQPEDYAPPHMRSEEDQNKISQCGFELANLTYVSPQLISVSRYSGQSEDCEERGGHYELDYRVRNFDSDAGLSFRSLLGAEAHGAYLRALPKHAVSDDGRNCDEPDRTSDSGWRIAHYHGQWRPYIHQSRGMFGCAVDAPVSFALPASLTGDAATNFDWKLQSKLWQSKVGDLTDVYISPTKDLAIVSSASEIRIFELRAGMPGPLLLTLPAGQIVMAQWATGRHVQDWTANIEQLAHQPLPATVVREKAALQ